MRLIKSDYYWKIFSIKTIFETLRQLGMIHVIEGYHQFLRHIQQKFYTIVPESKTRIFLVFVRAARKRS